MSVNSVPVGGLNTGVITVPLVIQCPKDCECGSSKPKPWFHAKCGEPSFITSNGDILCKNHLKDCQGYFIKDAVFSCKQAQKSNTWYEHKKLSEILMALSMALQAAELNLSDNDQIAFIDRILLKVRSRWNN